MAACCLIIADNATTRSAARSFSPASPPREATAAMISWAAIFWVAASWAGATGSRDVTASNPPNGRDDDDAAGVWGRQVSIAALGPISDRPGCDGQQRGYCGGCGACAGARISVRSKSLAT